MMTCLLLECLKIAFYLESSLDKKAIKLKLMKFGKRSANQGISTIAKITIAIAIFMEIEIAIAITIVI